MSQDPLGRLAGTIRWLTVTTFGSTEAIKNEASRVNRLHERVTGEYQKATGDKVTYRAADPDLLLWVHIAFMDSFLRAHQKYSATPIPGGADAYVSLWSRSVEPLGLTSAPEWLVTPVTRFALKAMRLAIGPESPIEDAAKARLVRIGAWQPQTSD
ncbi:MAG: hypothetical protein RL174_368 [Actinomycetota bacterium]